MADDYNYDQTPITSSSSSPIVPQSKPSIAIIVGVLTFAFILTVLFLLYAKHCYRHPRTSSNQIRSSADRRNSGLSPDVVNSLPAFLFGSLHGPTKDDLECAVCLNHFQPSDLLRLLPSCDHAFHVDCVDVWFQNHSTCPLCRVRVGDSETNPEPNKEASVREGEGVISNNNAIEIVVDQGGEVTGDIKEREEFEKRYGHRIVVSEGGEGKRRDGEGWIDLRPSDLVWTSGRKVNNLRSVSEMGLRRFDGIRAAIRNEATTG